MCRICVWAGDDEVLYTYIRVYGCVVFWFEKENPRSSRFPNRRCHVSPVLTRLNHFTLPRYI